MSSYSISKGSRKYKVYNQLPVTERELARQKIMLLKKTEKGFQKLDKKRATVPVLLKKVELAEQAAKAQNELEGMMRQALWCCCNLSIVEIDKMAPDERRMLFLELVETK